MKELIDSYGAETILRSLAVEKLSDKEYKFEFSSPFRTDRNPSMVCYKNTYFCVDFGGSFRGSLARLVKELTGKTLFEFLDVKDSIGSFMFSQSLLSNEEHVRSKMKKSSSIEEAINRVEIDGKLESVYDHSDAMAELRRRGMVSAFVNHFNIQVLKYGYVNRSKYPWKDRLIIPIVEKGKWLSVEGRDYTRTQAKKVLYPKGGTSNTLFNIDNLKFDEPLYVVEGIMDTVNLWQYVSRNVTCTFGVNVTNRQREMLSRFSSIVLFIDDDRAGEEMINSFDEFLEEEFAVMWVNGKDPGDATEEETKKAIENSVNSTEYYINKHELFDTKQPANAGW